MRQSWAVYCAAPQGEQYSAQRKFATCFGFAARQSKRTTPQAACAPEPKHIGRTVRRESANAGRYRGGRKERQPEHP